MSLKVPHFIFRAAVHQPHRHFLILEGLVSRLNLLRVYAWRYRWDVDDSDFQLAVVDSFIKLPYLRSIAIYTSYQVTSTE